MNRPMKLVLYSRKKPLCGTCVYIVIDGSHINISNFLIKLPLTQTNFTDTLELLFKILFCQNSAAVFQAFIIHCKAFDCVILYNLIRPFAELYCAFIVHFEAHGNNHLQVVMLSLIHISEPTRRTP